MNEHLVACGAALTAEIARPARRLVRIDPAAKKALVALLTPGARSRLGEQPIRVDAFFLDAKRPQSGAAPFAWSPRTARRQLGLAAVRTCVWGLTANPTDGVLLEIERLCRRVNDGMERRGSLAWFLADASEAVRTATIGTAVSYATELWTAVDWRALPDRPIVGAPDDRVCHPAGGLVLHGRADVRVALRVHCELGNTGSSEVRLQVLAGRPRREARLVLAGAALSAALASRHGDVPTKMVGLFPESGRSMVMDIDEITLKRAAVAISNRVVQVGQVPSTQGVSTAA